MQGYRIKDLNRTAQDIIRNEKLDKNNDGLINDDNGELAELLSKSGAKNIDKLKGDVFMSILCGVASAGLMAYPYGQEKAGKLETKYNLEEINRLQTRLSENDKNLLEKLEKGVKLAKSEKITVDGEIIGGQIKKHKYTIEGILKDMPTLKSKAAYLVMGGLLGLVALKGYFTPLRKVGEDDVIVKNKTEQKVEIEKSKEETNIYKEKYTQAFQELGIPDGTVLKEYTPQRGEFWISILKAKYSVDDVTAQKMANKIKEMIYDDPKAAKQTPVMYLPETWNFEGQTYQYKETVSVEKTENYSDDVKTEMGKMSKDLIY